MNLDQSWFCLSTQARGVGSAFIRAQDSYGLVFVLGEPAFYRRFGFSTDLAAQSPCVYSGPYFMALFLLPSDVALGAAVYAQTFARLS
ncbi:GCN5 family acetyltransferase (fragment) [Candidatus Filomicrobium marinum]|uniref:GCN5 family acetyltransferase n=1 Tax=Candidatus Filomicrobium marinum TaxID=1608628 RepID=A0A0D6JAM6_9HYPH